MKKLLTYAVVIATIVWSMGLGALIPTASAAYTPVANDIVKVSNSASGSSAVYIIGADLKPYVFSTRNTYGTWFDNFNTLKFITQVEFDAMTLGGNVTLRPGTLMKFDNGTNVYAVVPGNKLCKLSSDAAAKSLYGINYAARVQLIQVSFVSNYTVDTACALDASSTLPNATLIQYAGSSDIYYIQDGLKRLVTNEAFLANGFKTANIVTNVPTTMTYTTGTSITGKEAGLTTVTLTGAPIVVIGGNLTASLSSSNPGATTVPEGAEVDLLKVNLAAGSKDVNVTGLTIKRSGMSASTAIEELSIYVGTTRYGSVKSTWSSDKTMSFNFPSPIAVTAGNSVTVTVKGKIGTGSYAGVLINAATDIMTNGTVAGSFPISGNLMSIASGVSSASLLLENPAADTMDSNAGDSDVVLAGFDLTEQSNEEDVLMTGVTFINGGTAESTAVRNLRLYVDGTEVGKAEMSGNTATFSFDAVTIKKGDTAEVELRGDINNGEVDTTLVFYVSTITAVGKDLGFNASADFTALDRKTDAGVNTITLKAGDVTMAFNKSATGGTVAKDVRPETDDVELATLELTSNDEDVTINSIDEANGVFRLTGTDLEAAEVDNVRLMDTAGGTYDVTATWVGGIYELTMDEQIYLTKGVKKTFKVVADLTATIDENTTIRVQLDSAAIDHEGETSGSTALTFTPGSISSAISTVKKAYLTITNTQLTGVTVVPSAPAVLVYQGKLKAGASSALTIKELTLTTFVDGGDLFSDTNIYEMRLYINGVKVGTKQSAISETGGAGDTITFTSLSAVIPANTEYVVKVEADFNANFSAGVPDAFNLNIADDSDVIARDVDNNVLDSTQKNTVTAAGSRTVNLSAVGVLTVDLLNDNNENWNKNLYVLAGNGLPTGRALAEIKITTQNEDITINEIQLAELGSATASDIETVELVDSTGVVVTSASYEEGTITLDTDFTVAKDSTKKLYVKVKALGKNVLNDATSNATAGNTAQFGIVDVTATGVDTGEDIGVAPAGDGSPAAGEFDDTDTTKTASLMYVVLDSIVSDSSGISTGLTTGNDRIIAKYSLVFNNANNRDTENGEYSALLESLNLTITTSTNVAVADVQAYIEGASGDKTDAVDAGTGVAIIDFSTIEGESKYISGAAKIVIIGDVTVTGADPESLQTSIEDLSSEFSWDGGVTNGGDSRLLDTTVQGTQIFRN